MKNVNVRKRTWETAGTLPECRTFASSHRNHRKHRKCLWGSDAGGGDGNFILTVITAFVSTFFMQSCINL